MKKNKKREQLKWEYLKRSDLYREYCEWQRKAKHPALVLPNKFQPATGPIQDINPIVMTFQKYGDIHKQKFEDWYCNYFEDDKKGTQIPYKDLNLGAVDDLSGADPGMQYFLRNTFIFIIDNYKKNYGGQEPSLLEMAELLRYQMHIERGFQSYLKIRQSDFTAEEARLLADEVKEILMKRVPRDRLRNEELEKYLIVYDMRKEKRTDDEIIKKIYKVDGFGNIEGKRTKDNKGGKEVTDEINKFFEYAKRIIINSESDIYSDENIFPGEYYKK